MPLPAPNEVAEIIAVIVAVVRNIAMKRALADPDPDPHPNFWRMTEANAIDIAVLEWCKLFGSDDEDGQQIHWKNVVEEPATFRRVLFEHLAIEPAEWRTYWAEVKAYRDTCVAHHDFTRDPAQRYPVLDLAPASCIFYYDYLNAFLRRSGIERFPTDLEAYYDVCEAQTARIAGVAMAATEHIEERVLRMLACLHASVSTGWASS